LQPFAARRYVDESSDSSLPVSSGLPLCFGRLNFFGSMMRAGGMLPMASRARRRALLPASGAGGFLRFFIGRPPAACLTPICRDPYNEDDKGGPVRSIGLPELLIILGVAVLLFGGKKIPELAKGLGEGIRNFKNALKEEQTPVKPEEKKQA
jgi:sec-independent protein translocase protein TatA